MFKNSKLKVNGETLQDLGLRKAVLIKWCMKRREPLNLLEIFPYLHVTLEFDAEVQIYAHYFLYSAFLARCSNQHAILFQTNRP